MSSNKNLLREPLRAIIPAVLLLAIAAALGGCRSDLVFEETFLIMGTVCTVKAQAKDAAAAAAVFESIRKTLRSAEAAFNAHDPNSRLAEINRRASEEAVALTPEEAWMLRRALDCSEATGGSFDITFRPLWELWKQCEREERLPRAEEIRTAKRLVDFRALELSPDGSSLRFARPGMSVDLGGIAKGAALLACRDAATAPGVGGLLVNLGGDILALGRERSGGWMVGIQDPADPKRITARFKALNKLTLTSGIYERFVAIQGRRYHHIMDAQTGFPAGGFLSVTIVLDPQKDAYLPSLAVFLMGPERAVSFLTSRPEIGYYLVADNGNVRAHLP